MQKTLTQVLRHLLEAWHDKFRGKSMSKLHLNFTLLSANRMFASTHRLNEQAGFHFVTFKLIKPIHQLRILMEQIPMGGVLTTKERIPFEM